METWKKHPTIKDLEGSTEGHIRRPSGKPLNIHINHGYQRVSVGVGWVYVHQIICDIFKPRPERDKNHELKIDHADNNPMNNSVDNLQWLTNSENIKKAGDKLNTARRRNTPIALVDIENRQVTIVKSSAKVARMLNLCDSTISRCLDGTFKTITSKGDDTKGKKYTVYRIGIMTA